MLYLGGFIMPESEGLSRFAEAGVDFAVATAILAILAAALTQALYDIGLRSILQKNLVRWWFFRKNLFLKDSMLLKWRFLRKILPQKDSMYDSKYEWSSWLRATRDLRLYSLPYEQLCGQVSSIIQTELDQPEQAPLLEIFADPGDHENLVSLAKGFDEQRSSESEAARRFMNARQRVNSQAEKALDELQVYLSFQFSMWTYIISIAFSFSIIIILVETPNQFILGPRELPLYFSIGLAGGLLAPVIRTLLERILKTK